MFLGLIMKHHRVQIAPVHVRARFCVRESFSAGLVKSLAPARTRVHYPMSDAYPGLYNLDRDLPS